MATIIEKITHRLGYEESVVITRDEYNELEAQIAEGDSFFDAQYKAKEELDAVKKQLDLAQEIIEGIVECIDDDGTVTEGDKEILARRIVAAVKFVENL
jgi:phage pi2 protein 07